MHINCVISVQIHLTISIDIVWLLFTRFENGVYVLLVAPTLLCRTILYAPSERSCFDQLQPINPNAMRDANWTCNVRIHMALWLNLCCCHRMVHGHGTFRSIWLAPILQPQPSSQQTMGQHAQYVAIGSRSTLIIYVCNARHTTPYLLGVVRTTARWVSHVSCLARWTYESMLVAPDHVPIHSKSPSKKPVWRVDLDQCY